MEVLTLTRGQGNDQGTPGTLRGAGLSLFTLELPWRDNLPARSCIHYGQYICRLCHSVAFGRDLYRLADVPGRSGVLIHAGNWAGDVALGWISKSQGCILPGLARGTASGQMAVLNSVAALRILMARMGGADFVLQIVA